MHELRFLEMAKMGEWDLCFLVLTTVLLNQRSDSSRPQVLDRDESLPLIKRAFDLGINFFGILYRIIC